MITPRFAAALLLAWCPYPVIATAQPGADPRTADATLDALVAGVALYPDALLESVLQAATHPLALHRQASNDGESSRRGPLARRVQQERVPAAVTELAQYPEVLRTLDEHLSITARLGRAYAASPEQVWAAIGRVRGQIEQATQSAPDGAAESAPADLDARLMRAMSEVAETLYAPQAVLDLVAIDVDAEVATLAPIVITPTSTATAGSASGGGTAGATHGSTSLQSATVTGQAGTLSVAGARADATVAAAGGTLKVGDTTYGGVAAAGTLTTDNGTTVSGAAGAVGSVTTTATGTAFQSTAGGMVVNEDTGNYAGVIRHGEGTTTTNAGGSVDVERTASGALTSSAGNATWQHEGSAHVTGDGSGSYQGSSSVDTANGTVNTSTSAGNGEVSTTVDGANGTQTYTAGDGSVGNGSSSKSAKDQPGSSASAKSPTSASTTSGSPSSGSSSSGRAGPPTRTAGGTPPTTGPRFGQSQGSAGDTHAPTARGSAPTPAGERMGRGTAEPRPTPTAAGERVGRGAGEPHSPQNQFADRGVDQDQVARNASAALKGQGHGSPPGLDFNSLSPERVGQANAGLQQSWGDLSSRMSTPGGTRPSGGHGSAGGKGGGGGGRSKGGRGH